MQQCYERDTVALALAPWGALLQMPTSNPSTALAAQTDGTQPRHAATRSQDHRWTWCFGSPSRCLQTGRHLEWS